MTVNVLIDHGSAANVGDAAMLQGVLRQYLSRDNVRPVVLPKKDLPLSVTESLGVELGPSFQLRPRLSEKYIAQCPILWRFAERWGTHWSNNIGLMCVNRRVPLSLFANSSDLSTLRQLAKNFDALHIVGGGNLTDVFGRTLLEKCALVSAFSREGKAVVFSGQQIGPFSSRIAAHAAYHALRQATYVGVREPTASLDHCRSAGLDERQYSLMGDDSFGVDADDGEVVERILRENCLQRGNFIAVNVRLASYAKKDSVGIEVLATRIKELASLSSMPVLFVPIAFNDCDSDVVTGRAIKELCGDCIRVLDGRFYEVGVLKGLLNSAFGALGVSYHFCTFSLSQGLPCISLFAGPYYEQKCRGLSSLWQCERLAMSLSNLQNDSRAVGEIWATLNDHALRQTLKSGAELFKHSWQAKIKHCCDIVTATRHNLANRYIASQCT